MNTKPTGYPIIDEILKSIAPKTSAPPDPSAGEWRVECQRVIVAEPPRGRVVIKDVQTLRVIVCEDGPNRWEQALKDFDQIVADHAAVSRLVAALTEMLEIVRDEGHADNYQPQVVAAVNALALATTPPAAGEGR